METEIFHFSDPGEYLKNAYIEIKKEFPGISHRYISAKMGFSSSSIFRMIIKGRMNPSSRTIDTLANIFGLNQERRDYLALLFELRKKHDYKLREIIKNQLGLKGD